MPLPSPLAITCKSKAQKLSLHAPLTPLCAPMLDVRRMCDLLRFELDSFFLLLLLRIISNNKNNINKRRNNNNKKLDFLAYVDSTDDGSCRHRLQNFAVFFFCISYRSKAMARGYISYMKFIRFADWVSESRVQSQLLHLFLNSVLLPLRIYLLLLLHSEFPPGVERSPLLHYKCIFAATSATN